ncbi:MAG: DivIVA domain-containing protein [Acidimicrobiales bacterium]
MELTLKRLLEHAEFKKYRGKGYDPTEVDDFLDRAAAMAGKVEVQLTQAMEAAKAAGNGGPSPEQIEAEVERRVAERLAAAPAPAAGPSEDEIAEEARRTLALAQRTADAAVREAREEADQILEAAKAQAETLVGDAQQRADQLNDETDALVNRTREDLAAEADRERREARTRLAAEIGELEGVREALRTDVNVLERHVEEQRSQLGSTLAELQQILDDPSGFRMAPPPALIDPELPDFSDLAEPAVPEAPVEPVAEPEPEVIDLDAEADAVVDAEADGAEPVVELGDADAGGDAPPSAPTLAFDEVDHEAPGLSEPPDAGPPTAPVSAVDLGLAEAEEPGAPDDDPFLAELRKAMADDEPLGPRDHDDIPGPDPLFDDDDRRGWRFGRRR